LGVESRFKAKHSLDSDEEDEVKEVEKEGLGDEDLAAQEASTIVSEEKTPIHPNLCSLASLTFTFLYRGGREMERVLNL